MRSASAKNARQQLLPSGAQPIYKNRAGWAHDRPKHAGLSSSPRRGFWKATSEGLEFARTHPAPLSSEVTTKLAMGYLGVRLRPAAGTPCAEDDATGAVADDALGHWEPG